MESRSVWHAGSDEPHLDSYSCCMTSAHKHGLSQGVLEPCTLESGMRRALILYKPLLLLLMDLPFCTSEHIRWHAICFLCATRALQAEVRRWSRSAVEMAEEASANNCLTWGGILILDLSAHVFKSAQFCCISDIMWAMFYGMCDDYLVSILQRCIHI